MRTIFDLGDGLELAIAEPDEPGGGGEKAANAAYPTTGLQKGLLLLDREQDLSGEGVGFGVPVLKRGARCVFAGSAEITVDPAPARGIAIVYAMDRMERLGGRNGRGPLLRPLDEAREAFALLYRRVPLLRRPLLTASNGIRWLLRVKTRFEPTSPVATVQVTYSAGDRSGDVVVRADLGGLPDSVTEVVFMNELGAEAFDRFFDADGADKRGPAIGAWNEVRAVTASFADATRGVTFSLESDPDPGAPDVRLYRGREIAKGRLAWAGFGYSLKPGPPSFTYTLRLSRDGAQPKAGATVRREAGEAAPLPTVVDSR